VEVVDDEEEEAVVEELEGNISTLDFQKEEIDSDEMGVKPSKELVIV
jgi:hypothetical protein